MSDFKIQHELKENQYFKLAKADGWDAHTGNTINYRENVGKLVKAPKQVKDGFELCSDTVIHATKDPLNWLNLTGLPFSLFVVEGVPTVKRDDKCGFSEFTVLKEIPANRFDELLGFKYSEAIKPLDPRAIIPPTEIETKVLTLMYDWDSVRSSVWASVWDSVWASVWASVWDSVRDSVWASVWDSVRDSVRSSVRSSVRDSVRDIEYAYVGTLFPQVKKWKYLSHKEDECPFQSAVELLRLGLVPVIDQYTKTGYLCHPKQNDKADILWKGTLDVFEKI